MDSLCLFKTDIFGTSGSGLPLHWGWGGAAVGLILVWGTKILHGKKKKKTD